MSPQPRTRSPSTVGRAVLSSVLTQYPRQGAILSLLKTRKRHRVIELTYTAWDLEPFANDVGYHGSFCLVFLWALIGAYLIVRLPDDAIAQGPDSPDQPHR